MYDNLIDMGYVPGVAVPLAEDRGLAAVEPDIQGKENSLPTPCVRPRTEPTVM